MLEFVVSEMLKFGERGAWKKLDIGAKWVSQVTTNWQMVKAIPLRIMSVQLASETMRADMADEERRNTSSGQIEHGAREYNRTFPVPASGSFNDLLSASDIAKPKHGIGRARNLD